MKPFVVIALALCAASPALAKPHKAKRQAAHSKPSANHLQAVKPAVATMPPAALALSPEDIQAKQFSDLYVNVHLYFLVVHNLHYLTAKENKEEKEIEALNNMPLSSLRVLRRQLNTAEGIMAVMRSDEAARLAAMTEAPRAYARVKASPLFKTYLFAWDDSELTAEEARTAAPYGVVASQVPRLDFNKLVPAQALPDTFGFADVQQRIRIYNGFVLLANQEANLKNDCLQVYASMRDDPAVSASEANQWRLRAGSIKSQMSDCGSQAYIANRDLKAITAYNAFYTEGEYSLSPNCFEPSNGYPSSGFSDVSDDKLKGLRNLILLSH